MINTMKNATYAKKLSLHSLKLSLNPIPKEIRKRSCLALGLWSSHVSADQERTYFFMHQV